MSNSNIGGLVQIVSSGKQDVYLTYKPEITFFKKVYKKHTNFSIEFIEIYPEQSLNYNNIISFMINNGDAIHRCYLEIELPNLVFSDKYITNINYINKKNTDIVELEKLLKITQNKYNNLLNYINIDMLLYRTIYNSLQIDNITIQNLKDLVYNFNNLNKLLKNQYINKIDIQIYSLINISDYILGINKIITTNELLDQNIYIFKNTIINKLNDIYKSMQYYLKNYNNDINKINVNIKNINNRNIKFNFSNFLGHNYFNYFTLEIGGQEIQKYSNNVLHINQMHKINQDSMQNYLEMIGHTPELNSFNEKTKGNTKILVPLIFWFNKDPGSCLPLVSLQYSNVVINAKINNLEKIISLENYEDEYKNLLDIRIPFNSETNININNNLYIYDTFIIDYENKYIKYNCILINDNLLKYHFTDLSDNEIKSILVNNGKLYYSNEILNLTNRIFDNQFLIDKFGWIKLMTNLNNSSYDYNNYYYKFASYYPYINFNLYYSLVDNPKIKLITESIYFDDIERDKFANSKLEYIIEIFDENIYNINQSYFDCELSFNNPCKELLWYIQPQLFIDGITEYGQNTSLNYDSHLYFKNELINDQKLIFNQYDVLLPNVNSNYYTYLLSYKYLNNILPLGVYYKSFCLYPEESQPSGTINLRYFKGKQYYVNFNSDFLKEYLDLLNLLYTPSVVSYKNSFILRFISKNYDLISINNGKFEILFSI
uniref:Major capsid protein N-terminal domain-containing protein n=1 Tax=viral metagenome TaxID=1070528 RepID=A0A6C0ED73_9ZZZZ